MKNRKRISGAGSTPTGGYTRYSKTMGIDVDSKFLVVAFADRDQPDIRTIEYENDHVGIARLVKTALEYAPSLVVCESTANFHIAAYDALLAAGVSTVVINPLHVKSLLRVEGKSDKADAVTLARLALSFRLKPSNVPDDHQRQLRTYIRLIRDCELAIMRSGQRIQSHLLGVGVTLYRNVGFHSVKGQRALQLMVEGKAVDEVLQAVQTTLVKRSVDEQMAADSVRGLSMASRIFIQQQQGVALLSIGQAEQAREHLFDLIAEFGLQDLVNLLATVPTLTPILAINLIAEFGANAPDRYQHVGQMVSAGGLAPNTEVSGGKITKRTLQLGGKRSVKIPLMQVAKGYVLRKRTDPLWLRWSAYREKAGYGKGLKWLARNVLEMAYYVWVHRVSCDQYAHFGLGKPEVPETLPIALKLRAPARSKSARLVVPEKEEPKQEGKEGSTHKEQPPRKASKRLPAKPRESKSDGKTAVSPRPKAAKLAGSGASKKAASKKASKPAAKRPATNKGSNRPGAGTEPD